MKRFNNFQKKNKPISSKLVEGFRIEIEKNDGEYQAYIDGDMLDSYRSKAEAEKAAMQFVKQYKG